MEASDCTYHFRRHDLEEVVEVDSGVRLLLHVSEELHQVGLFHRVPQRADGCLQLLIRQLTCATPAVDRSRLSSVAER